MTDVLVLLVRHATHAAVGERLCGRAPGFRLGAEGLAEAASLGRAAAALSPAAIYSSPLERAQETAACISREAGAPVITAQALDEIDFGAWTGVRFDALQDDPAWRAWNLGRASAKPPGGEGMAAAQGRIWDWLASLPHRHPGSTVVAVSHADMIKAALFRALGLSLDLYDRLQVDPASISRLVVGDWGAKVLSINEAVNGWTDPRADQGARRRARRLVPQHGPGRDRDRPRPLPAGLSQ